MKVNAAILDPSAAQVAMPNTPSVQADVLDRSTVLAIANIAVSEIDKGR
jgi:hypothetical protein